MGDTIQLLRKNSAKECFFIGYVYVSAYPFSSTDPPIVDWSDYQTAAA